MRTALTGFAVSWGIFMLIVLLGAGNGVLHSFENQSKRKALNSVRVTPGWTSLEYQGLREGRRVRINEADIAAVTSNLSENIIDALPIVTRYNIMASFGQDYISTSLMGVYPNYNTVEVVKIEKGRFINQIDMDEMRKVCIIGNKSAEVLFPHTDPIGKFINVSDVAYHVVGIYSDSNEDMSMPILVPFTTVMTIYDQQGYVSRFTLTTKGLETVEKNDAFTERLFEILGNRRKFDKNDTNALWIWNRMSNYLTTQTAMNILNIVIWVIGILTLISGIVGVSNIMLITVKERTHEFGIRKALGAKPRQILMLIVTESICITALFGYIGMVFGIGITELMNYIIEQGGSSSFQDPTVDLAIAIEATMTLVIAGTLAGFWPAKRAVSIKPIEALRG